MTVVTAILRAADQHSRLISGFDRMQAAASRLVEVRAEISHQEARVKESEARIVSTKAGANDAQNELASLEDSARARLATKLGVRSEKLEENTRVLEQALAEAVEAKERANTEHVLAMQHVLQAQAEEVRLLREIGPLSQTRAQLEDLYSSIFSGPTPEYIEEDVAEEKLTLASASLADLTARFPIERRVGGFLSSALTKMEFIMMEMQDATLVAAATPYRALRREKICRALVEIQLLLTKAQVVQPLFKIQEDISMPDDNWADLIPNYFPDGYDFAHRDKIRTKLKTVRKTLKAHLEAQKGWIRSLRTGLETAEKEVKEAREELFLVRRGIFERVVQTGGDLPPEYEG